MYNHNGNCMQPANANDYLPQTYYPPVPSVPVNPVVETERLKSDIRIAEAQQKAKIEINKKLVLDDERYYRREKRRIQKEAEYREITITPNGEINVEIKNSLNARQLSICNFTFPQLQRLYGTYGEEGLFLLKFEIRQKEQEIYLHANKISSGKYVLDKIRAVGGMIQCKKNQDAENFVRDLITHLIGNELVWWIPSEFGWNKHEGYFFVEEGEFIWKDAMKKAD